jgi:hypothetical protein
MSLMSRMKGALAVGVAAWLAGMVAAPSRVVAREVGPEANLCAEINSLSPGEELVLLPGDYRGLCAIRRGGEAGAPVTIRAADLERRPRVIYEGARGNVLEIRASHVRVRGLEFGPTLADVDAVRIFSGSDIVVEECRFSEVGGIAVVANHNSVRGLAVRRNVILDSKATGMYFGCHDGISCVMGNLVVEWNYIRGVTAPDPQIGYGLEVKLNSSGIIRDNIVVDTKGPGIMVYGARDLVAVTLVERNVTIGSRTSSGIVVGGGPAIVRNNVAALNAEAGIGVEDYGKRGLTRAIVVVNNTVYMNDLGGIMMPKSGVRDVIVVNNAAHVRAGLRALPESRSGLRLAGNVDCTLVRCFANPDGMDFSPFPGSLLVGMGMIGLGDWLPREDFFGTRRGALPTVGAIEKPSGRIRTGPPL